jgi:hypothetical protein
LIQATTKIPKSQVFRFENYWLEHEQFPLIAQHGWNLPCALTDKARIVGANFKNPEKGPKSMEKSAPKSEKDDSKL